MVLSPKMTRAFCWLLGVRFRLMGWGALVACRRDRRYPRTACGACSALSWVTPRTCGIHAYWGTRGFTWETVSVPTVAGAGLLGISMETQRIHRRCRSFKSDAAVSFGGRVSSHAVIVTATHRGHIPQNGSSHLEPHRSPPGVSGGMRTCLHRESTKQGPVWVGELFIGCSS